MHKSAMPGGDCYIGTLSRQFGLAFLPAPSNVSRILIALMVFSRLNELSVTCKAATYLVCLSVWLPFGAIPNDFNEINGGLHE
ncbi:MAG: hypothetical protein GX040_01565 [Alcaligenaceae bacterium]|nr:hypothetical protein [Alcaligenaceae bacterium]